MFLCSLYVSILWVLISLLCLSNIVMLCYQRRLRRLNLEPFNVEGVWLGVSSYLEVENDYTSEMDLVLRIWGLNPTCITSMENIVI
ncbi:hypothetical protein F5Y04DRAFT_260656 [Hypomontagnella monticulosa]|nr:hypothetical protein F5Y04DRAFT_260656 [Hypomontagnella monticulosa]